jgi:dynein heavy chain
LRCCLQALQSVASAFLATAELPDQLRPAIVEHMMMVHQSVRQFSARFAEELRRHNYVTVSLVPAGASCSR